MRLYLGPLGIVALTASDFSSAALAAEPVRVGGTGAAFGFLQSLGDAYSARSGVKVVNVPSLGSGGGLRAVAEDKIDLAVSGRSLRADEIAKGLAVVMIVRTPYFIVTSHRNPGGLKSADMATLYAKPNATWADGSPVRIVLRPRSDSDTDLMGELFAGMAQALEAARSRPEVPTGATDQDNGDLAERISGSLTGMTGTQLKMENRRLRAVALDGVEATFSNFENGTYRYSKKLYFVVKGGGSPEVVRFIDFVRSAEGVKVLREAEALPETQ
jgi:phosphate transport system substrate-binding protein